MDFTLAMGEIKVEYLKACFSARPKPSLSSLSSDLAAARAATDRKLKEYLLRSVFAKATCFGKKVAKIQQKTAAEFFKTITTDEAKNIFGFDFIAKGDYFPALAFVIDTTGSMSEEIGTARNVIASIIKSEQQNPYFYVLTPFNDYDGDGTGRPSKLVNLRTACVDRHVELHAFPTPINMAYLFLNCLEKGVPFIYPFKKMHIVILMLHAARLLQMPALTPLPQPETIWAPLQLTSTFYTRLY